MSPSTSSIITSSIMRDQELQRLGFGDFWMLALGHVPMRPGDVSTREMNESILRWYPSFQHIDPRALLAQKQYHDIILAGVFDVVLSDQFNTIEVFFNHLPPWGTVEIVEMGVEFRSSLSDPVPEVFETYNNYMYTAFGQYSTDLAKMDALKVALKLNGFIVVDMSFRPLPVGAWCQNIKTKDGEAGSFVTRRITESISTINQDPSASQFLADMASMKAILSDETDPFMLHQWCYTIRAVKGPQTEQKSFDYHQAKTQDWVAQHEESVKLNQDIINSSTEHVGNDEKIDPNICQTWQWVNSVEPNFDTLLDKDNIPYDFDNAWRRDSNVLANHRPKQANSEGKFVYNFKRPVDQGAEHIMSLPALDRFLECEIKPEHPVTRQNLPIEWFLQPESLPRSPQNPQNQDFDAQTSNQLYYQLLYRRADGSQRTRQIQDEFNANIHLVKGADQSNVGSILDSKSFSKRRRDLRRMSELIYMFVRLAFR